MKKVVIGCGDVGRRIVKALLANGVPESHIVGIVQSIKSQNQCVNLGIVAERIDLDEAPGRWHSSLFDFGLMGSDLTSLDSSNLDSSVFDQAELYYTVAPQKDGVVDRRSEVILKQFDLMLVKPAKAVVISTTGVYGDCDGEWVTEKSATNPQTKRGQRRLDLERQWLTWGERNGIEVVILRVPGIYSFSRLPRERIAKRTPVVNAAECGYSNRIHADDLADICIVAMHKARAGELFNATDGTPGKISEYLQVAAEALGQAPLPEISMTQGQQELSSGMLSYLSESRKISNQKMLDELNVQLQYPDFREGVKH